MTHELYRKSKIGEALTETLDEMINSGTIDPKLAMLVVRQFDAAIAEALGQKVKTKVTMKGKLHTYRFCDDVWTLILSEGAQLKFDQAEVLPTEKVKIIAMSAVAPKKDEAKPEA